MIYLIYFHVPFSMTNRSRDYPTLLGKVRSTKWQPLEPRGCGKKQTQLPVKFTEPSGDKVDIIDSGKIGAAWLALSSLIFCSHYLVPTGFWVFLELEFCSTEKCRKSEHHSMNWDILVECDAGLNSFHGALVTWMFLVCCNHCGARLGMDSSYTCIPPNH